MKDLVKQSYQIAELSIIDHGDFCFRQQYQHLIVDQQRWFKMTQKQRQSHINKVAATVPTHSISEEMQNNLKFIGANFQLKFRWNFPFQRFPSYIAYF